ncbi:hypothetical protein I3760_14G037900 [Carya illinoinensis]|nr:hypothetical protein I3760_14G037900 [Carya illinoinensis]
MVVKLIGWPAWPPPSSKKFEAILLVRRLEGLTLTQFESGKALVCELKWKGQKGALSLLRHSAKRNFTKEVGVGDDGEQGSSCWNWIIELSEYTSEANGKETQINVSVKVANGTAECSPLLWLSVSLMELVTAQQPSETVQKSIVCLPLSPCYAEANSTERDEFSALKAGVRKVKTSQIIGNKGHYSISRPFSYETLAFANSARGLSYTNAINNSQNDFWIYYSTSKLNVGCRNIGNSHALISEQILRPNLKRNILSWKKRKLSFRIHKAKVEPLLKKHYGEVGGDDIDYDRRQLSSSGSDESSFGTNGSSISEFGDEKFALGSWECKEVYCRDKQLKLQTQVFFASIDQWSERAGGESECTALVAVIADWLHSNRDELPIKSEFDRRIRDGSLEWRNLCHNEAYIEQFPDKHFDLETIFQAKIRPLSVVSENSFIGFFHPEVMEERSLDLPTRSNSALDCSSYDEPVYIVCWNDHFFMLKVEEDAYYIIDTMRERLYEGCNQAYVLKFDKDTTIVRLSNENQASDDKPASDKVQPKSCLDSSAEGAPVVQLNESENSEREEVVCKGKE